MPVEEEIWDIERGFWIEGEAFYRQRLGMPCTMVFPLPVGILRDRAVIDALGGTPRWRDVEMTHRACLRPNDACLLLAYEATAQREGEPPYSALCSSSYCKSEDGWHLVQHQHTPIG
jgi:hypothetical protein